MAVAKLLLLKCTDGRWSIQFVICICIPEGCRDSGLEVPANWPGFKTNWHSGRVKIDTTATEGKDGDNEHSP